MGVSTKKPFIGIKVTFQGQESHFKLSGTADMRKQFWFVGLKMLPVVLSVWRETGTGNTHEMWCSVTSQKNTLKDKLVHIPWWGKLHLKSGSRRRRGTLSLSRIPNQNLSSVGRQGNERSTQKSLFLIDSLVLVLLFHQRHQRGLHLELHK